MTIKTLVAMALSASLLAACGQGGPAPKSEGAAMPTPTISLNAVDMPAGTQMSTLSMINAKMKKPIGDRPTSAYLTIENGGPTPETLISATSPDFARVEFNDHVKDGEMMKMVKLDTLNVPAGGQLVLDQGGKHLMLFEPKRALNNGDSIKVTLTFSNSGPIETNFVVLNEIPRAAGEMGDMPGMKH